MSRILITGSADGLGLMAGQLLISQGHEVMLHARSQVRAADACTTASGAAGVLAGHLSSMEQMRSVARQANDSGRFDAVIHNAGVGYRELRKITTADGLSHVFAVNVLAPFLLTAMIAAQAYSDSKLFDVVLAFALARRWPEVLSNALEPGWVPTKMGGARRAPDDLGQAHLTRAWLAVSDDPAATVGGAYFYHKAQRAPHAAATDTDVQEGLLAAGAELTGTPLPVPGRPAPPADRTNSP